MEQELKQKPVQQLSEKPKIPVKQVVQGGFVEEKKSKWWLWLIIALIVAGLAGWVILSVI